MLEINEPVTRNENNTFSAKTIDLFDNLANDNKKFEVELLIEQAVHFLKHLLFCFWQKLKK